MQDEIENMVREAEAHAETDKINRERVEAINQAEVRSALLKGLVSRERAPQGGEDRVASRNPLCLIFCQTPCVVSIAKPRVIVSFRRLVFLGGFFTYRS